MNNDKASKYSQELKNERQKENNPQVTDIPGIHCEVEDVTTVKCLQLTIITKRTARATRPFSMNAFALGSTNISEK